MAREIVNFTAVCWRMQIGWCTGLFIFERFSWIVFNIPVHFSLARNTHVFANKDFESRIPTFTNQLQIFINTAMFFFSLECNTRSGMALFKLNTAQRYSLINMKKLSIFQEQKKSMRHTKKSWQIVFQLLKLWKIRANFIVTYQLTARNWCARFFLLKTILH